MKCGFEILEYTALVILSKVTIKATLPNRN